MPQTAEGEGRSGNGILGTTEQELHILWGQTLHCRIVSVDSGVDHVCLLLLEQHHTRLDRILNAQSSDRARASLSDTMATISTLPLCRRIPPRIHNKDLRSLREVECDTTSLEGDEEALDVDVGHEVVDRGLALSRCHGTIEHHGSNSCTAEAPFDELQHGGELREDYRLRGGVLRAQFMDVVDKRFDLGGTGPVLHLDSVDDGRFLD
jgi:hypothetical protein